MSTRYNVEQHSIESKSKKTHQHTSPQDMPLSLQTSVISRCASSKLAAMKLGSYFSKTIEKHVLVRYLHMIRESFT